MTRRHHHWLRAHSSSVSTPDCQRNLEKLILSSWGNLYFVWKVYCNRYSIEHEFIMELEILKGLSGYLTVMVCPSNNLIFQVIHNKLV
jgi:hypothetical protein